MHQDPQEKLLEEKIKTFMRKLTFADRFLEPQLTLTVQEIIHEIRKHDITIGYAFLVGEDDSRL